MKIAVLGWGSLVPDPKELLIDKANGQNGWFDDGPLLPIEFARISKGNRLTLVIKPGSKTVRTKWAEMSVHSFEAAVENLRIRESLHSNERIGYINLLNNSNSNLSDHSEIDEIKTWAISKGFDAVIWTGLDSNFEEKTSELFGEKKKLSIENISWFFKKIEHSQYQSAKSYILSTPQSTETNFRGQIENLLRSGALLPDKVLMHEAGHILIAKAYEWDIDDLMIESAGIPLQVRYCKTVQNSRVCGVILNNHEAVAKETNWQRLVITQGGRAVDSIYNYKDENQYVSDDMNAQKIIAELPPPKPKLDDIRLKARKIVENNSKSLIAIKTDLENYIKGDRNIKLFDKDYAIRL